jgi:hypothetical protein
MTIETFRFARQPAARLPLLLWGVRSERTSVVVDELDVHVRFGRWELHTPRANVVTATVTGPYRWWRALGVRLSLSDRGITFGSSDIGGVCVQLRDPVPVRLGPLAMPLRHPNVTLTVEDPETLVRLLAPSNRHG